MKTSIQIVTEERQRQLDKEGWSAKHDDKHSNGELAFAASVYAIPNDGRNIIAGKLGRSNVKRILWPFDMHWFKPSPDNRIKELAKAGALILAEIDRLQRLEFRKKYGIQK